jgi:HAD superfamily hydrolase (TIGR01450 family)
MPCTVLCDLDGVVWLAHQPIPGAVEAVAALRSAGHRVVFVTNNSAARVDEHGAALEAIGIPAAGDVLSSAMASALLVSPGERVAVFGGPGVVEAMEERGAVPVEPELLDDPDVAPVDAVMVGFHRWFDFEGMRRAATAVRRGARLIGTNDDATYPTPDGPIPGGGSILAAVATAAGVTPVIAGKPHGPAVDLVRRMIGEAAVADAIVVGDRPSTDGLFARALGCRFALVLSGVTESPEGVDPVPDIVAADLAGVSQVLLAR